MEGMELKYEPKPDRATEFSFSFKREMNRNYMILEPKTAKRERYVIRMFAGNRIPCFLPLYEKQVNEKRLYYYDVTSRQPLLRLLDCRRLKGKELERLLADLLTALGQTEKYLLDEGCICLEPECIYVDPDSFQCAFCYIPGYDHEISLGLCDLSRYLLDQVDDMDENAVILAFSVFRECRKENFGVEDIEKCLKRSQRKGSRESEKIPCSKEELEQYDGTEWETEAEAEDRGDRGNAAGRGKGSICGSVAGYGNRNTGRDATGHGYGNACRDAIGHGYRNAFRDAIGYGNRNVCRDAIEYGDGYDCQNGVDHGSNSNHERLTEAVVGNKRMGILFPIGIFLLMAAVPLVLFFWLGMDGLLRLKWILGAAECLFGAGTLAWFLNKKQIGNIDDVGAVTGKNEAYTEEFKEQPEPVRKTEEAEEDPWELLFGQGRMDPDKAPEDEVQTMLLTVHPVEHECRRLTAVTGDMEIPVGYFPFLIGKSREMTDFCLNEPGVSRLHVRIEEKNGSYIVTDLNSTNGTKVNGVVLEANGSAELSIGGTLEIAGRKFQFR